MPKDTGKKLADIMYGQNPEQAAFGVFPQMRPRRTRQDPEAAKNVPVDLARGFVAGTLGIPGDLESFARLPYELITGNESPTILPTSEQIEKRLPFGSDTPAGRAASGLGTLAGSFYTGPGSMPKVIGNVARDVSGAISKARQPKATPEVKIPDLPPSVAEPIEVKSIPTPYRTEQPQGLSYETRQEGPFYRVKPNLPEAAARQDRGTKEGVGGAPTFIRSTGSDVPQPVTDEAVQAVMNKPDNFVRQVADEYSQKNTGEPYQLPQIPESSLLKQAPIGRVFDLAATDDPVYKKTVFDAYAKQYPQLVEQSGAQNYDQLMEASYRQLAKETEQQFRALPINMSYHRAGEGNYENSKELLRDIYGNRHMYVYQGGDPHDFLNAVDPATGLNTNEMFRAVHDFFGHAIHGNQFGPKGEEIAWAAHSKMFSPLARLAMTSETRGQNSFVNYTPLNAELKRNINELNGQLYEAKRRGNKAMVDEINKDLAEVWQGFQFAPQKSVILPPEFLDLKYSGGMPQYLQPLIKPKAGTTVASELTHFSPKEGLSTIDPRMFGTGIKGEEMQRLQGQPGAVMERSYFYTGDPAKATPEPGLGPYRYLGESSSLYDVAADPLKLRTLAAETQRNPYTSPVNPGMVTGSPFTDVERMVKEYGYEGLVNPTLTKPSAIMFKPTPVRPFKKGGAVHISDNPDVMQLELAGGGLVKRMAKVIGKAAEAAGQKAPVLAEKELTTLQDVHTNLGDRVRAGVMDAQKMMEGFDYKYDKGQRVFTKDSAGKNKPPYTILSRTRVGNQVMREDHPKFGPGMGRPIIDPETGKPMRTPYEPGYRVRMELGPDDWSEFDIPEKAIVGDVEFAKGGAVKALKGMLKEAKEAGYRLHTPLKPDPEVGTRYKKEFQGGLVPRQPLNIEDLEKSSVKIMPWDATSRNQLITEISGRPLTKPVLTEGGDEYMMDVENVANRIAGASNKAIAQRIQERINQAAAENQMLGGTGKVYGFTSRMGEFAENASTMPTDVAMDLLKQAELKKRELKELTESMRNMAFENKGKGYFKDMAPIGTPEFEIQLREGLKPNKKQGIEGFTAMNLRKGLMNRLGMAQYQKRLDYNLPDLTGAVLSDELKGVPKGYVGNVAAELDPFSELRPSKHSSYTHDFSGRYAGSMPNMPVEFLMPNTYEAIYREMRQLYPSAKPEALRNMAIGALEKRNKSVSEMIGPRSVDAVKTFQEGLTTGEFDPHDIEQIYEYMRRKKFAVPKKEGGEVTAPAASIDGNEFLLAARKYGLGDDMATLNKMVSLVNQGATVDEAARTLAGGAVRKAAGGEITADDLILEERKL